MKIPEELRYARTHEWVRMEGDVATVGLSDFAQEQLGDVVFVELPEVGRVVGAKDPVAVVESVKTASDIYAPLAGEIVEVNGGLGEAPEKINEDCYGAGWLLKLKPTAAAAVEELLDAAGYGALAEAES